MLKYLQRQLSRNSRSNSSSAWIVSVLLLVACYCSSIKPAASMSALYTTNATRTPGKLNVHIISHTHNDPGWLSSYAQYHRTLVLDGHVIGRFNQLVVLLLVLKALSTVDALHCDQYLCHNCQQEFSQTAYSNCQRCRFSCCFMLSTPYPRWRWCCTCLQAVSMLSIDVVVQQLLEIAATCVKVFSTYRYFYACCCCCCCTFPQAVLRPS
jgi:hypothetical protein